MMSMAPAVFNLDRNKTDRIVFNALDNVVLFKGESRTTDGKNISIRIDVFSLLMNGGGSGLERRSLSGK